MHFFTIIAVMKENCKSIGWSNSYDVIVLTETWLIPSIEDSEIGRAHV